MRLLSTLLATVAILSRIALAVGNGLPDVVGHDENTGPLNGPVRWWQNLTP